MHIIDSRLGSTCHEMERLVKKLELERPRDRSLGLRSSCASDEALSCIVDTCTLSAPYEYDDFGLHARAVHGSIYGTRSIYTVYIYIYLLHHPWYIIHGGTADDERITYTTIRGIYMRIRHHCKKRERETKTASATFSSPARSPAMAVSLSA